MKLRKITSLTAGISFIVTVVTSVILYIVPQGRIAYWADWRLFGMSKEQWGNIHINIGFLFLLTLGLHIYYNWTPIKNYLKNKTKNLVVFTKDFNAAMLLTLIFIIGTHFEIPPFSSILSVSESIKDQAAEKYGEPPYGHAELSSLKTFTKKVGLDLNQSMERIKASGLAIKGENQTLIDISKSNNVPPKYIYLTMKPRPEDGTSEVVPAGKPIKLPESPLPGTGNMTLADLCAQFNLNIKALLRDLSKVEIKAVDSETIKKIAENNQTSPTDIYEHIKAASLRQISKY